MNPLGKFHVDPTVKLLTSLRRLTSLRLVPSEDVVPLELGLPAMATPSFNDWGAVGGTLSEIGS